jgi:hypothetical protein
MKKGFHLNPGQRHESGHMAQTSSSLAARPEVACGSLAWPTSDWAGPRGVAQCGTEQRDDATTAHRAHVLVWSPTSKGCPTCEHEFTVSIPSSRLTGTARSRALAQIEEEGQRGEAAHRRQRRVMAAMVDGGLGRHSAWSCMTRIASIVHRNTKSRKSGVAMRAHRRGGCSGDVAPTCDYSDDREGGPVASRRTLRQGGAP